MVAWLDGQVTCCGRSTSLFYFLRFCVWCQRNHPDLTCPLDSRTPKFPIMQTVSILGAGPAGFALAAGLQNHGNDVLVYGHPTHQRHANQVRRNGGRLQVSGRLEGTFPIGVTSSMAEAVAFSRILILTVPSTGQETVLAELRPFDLRQHIIVAIPGNLFSLIASAAGIEVGCIFETNLSPYSCRMDDEGDGGLTVMGQKERVYIAPFFPSLASPSSSHGLHNNRRRSTTTTSRRLMTPEMYTTIASLFPTSQLRWCASILEVCLANVNGIFHPLMMLLNAGRIENTNGDFYLYSDGLTPAVERAMCALDSVRMQIGEALGYRGMQTAVEVSNECYGQGFRGFVDLATGSAPHNRLRAPGGMENRNLSEDVPDLLVTWCGLAERLGVDAGPVRAVITMAEMVMGVDYFGSGRGLARLGLEGMDRGELVERFGVGGDKERDTPKEEEREREKVIVPVAMVASSSRL
ncbi:6-phosphogluconate dehydrogenase [Chaetomium sp. MPI-SDFR-AT-0129]|nr:6-phosphogluconate dehydrogenase [Chaetomium sp. MPI-SDFR-AT-0129]